LRLENFVNRSRPPSFLSFQKFRCAVRILSILIVVFSVVGLSAQEVSPDSYAGLRWRFLGTHRGGRITSVSGIPGEPNIYYAGTPNGGVWKTIDGGRTWKPIFDRIPTLFMSVPASRGEVAVFSNPLTQAQRGPQQAWPKSTTSAPWWWIRKIPTL
jgi:hypothetical protein